MPGPAILARTRPLVAALSMALCSCLSAGCTSLALKNATLAHVGSSTDLRYRETVENLAMTAANPSFLPSYSSIFAGTTDVNDIVRGSSATVWLRTALKPIGYATGFSTETADFFGSRAVKSNWTLDPTIVPEKLRAMRAASRWAVNGPDEVGPDIRYLKTYEPAQHEEVTVAGKEGELARPTLVEVKPGDEPGSYFDVADRLAGLPRGWLHVEERRCDVPRGACYWAGCGDKYVWVGEGGMAGLSEFLLILQQIARADYDSTYFPKTQTRTVQKDFVFSELGKNYVATATLYLDENGRVTPSAGLPAIPVKSRIDNVGTNADLKSVINASAKSSQ